PLGQEPSVSSILGRTGAQTPGSACVSTAEQAQHTPPQALSQHTPSTQNPLAHWLAAPHPTPFSDPSRHTPVPSQVAVPPQGAQVPSMTFVRLPTQASHEPPQGVSQHTP